MVQPKSPQPNVQQRGEDARHRLIDAGIEVFGISGFEAASTRHIADKAGVNLAAIPYYFGSKEGLYRAVAEHIANDDEPAASTARRIDSHLAPIRKTTNT
ncbi:TetR family transcriptional regulator [Gloeocapsopsis crepidinum LEGE 06123]|uniref:TetR family transcriptional regulator n=1 Tax=Gloeocapsopsis crepidinum LEGE 06123 TaxID=588587 RepID=A0ABR9UQ16_9CHRO|nr:TetR family transcriptional regulator [Gloeocapsopsis crepidinum]MBE9190364.1 TetR family transcriptional regulator [Gloeocapsopsis crepidinum LEGE 06123]